MAHDDGVANHHMVFIDTSLDTHLAIIVSDSDTVSDFKRNIMLEHRQLFPAIGDVKIECLKVKRRGSFYKLSESMLVKSAFEYAKGNWFVSVDASRLEQNDGSQQLGKHKDRDQLALPWVTHSRSIERHGNDGSPSVHSKTAPLVNQKVPIVDQLTSGDSCKDVSKNVKEDRLCNDKQLDYELQEKLDTANTDINLKKRTRDVHNEGSLNDAFLSGPSLKKKRKTQRGKSDVKALEENLALRHDSDKVNDKVANVNNDSSFEHRSKGKKLSDENQRINKGENCSALDQVATVVPTIEGVGSETVGDVAMVMENNIQQEIAIGRSQKDTDSEVVQKPDMGDEPSSLMRTPDCEHGGAGVTDVGHMKRSTEHKAAEKEASSTASIKKLHSTPKNAIESSPDVVANEGILLSRSECPVNNDADISTTGKNTSQVNAQEKQDEKMDDTTKKKKRRRTKVSAGRNEDELLTKHVNRDICESVKEGESVWPDTDRTDVDMSSTVLASVIDERKMNEDLEKTLIDGKKGDDVIMKEVENSVENMEEESRKEFTNANDVVTGTNEENLLPQKQNDKTDDTTKKKKKRKTKKSAGRNEDESVPKNVDGDIFENVIEGDRKDGDKVKEKDARISYDGLAGKESKNNKSQDLQVELESKKSQSVDHHHLPEKTSENITASDVSKVNNEVDIPETESRDLAFRDCFANGHLSKKIVSTDNRKDKKKTKVDSRNDQSQKLVSKIENNKFSVDVLKDPNITDIDKFKTPKRANKIDAKKTNRQPTTLLQTRAKTMENKKVKGSQPVKRSHARKGMEGAGKNNMNSQLYRGGRWEGWAALVLV
ncbi:hypothetical protein M8C21_003951, partial [Ambrosia artemisiifolia]